MKETRSTSKENRPYILPTETERNRKRRWLEGKYTSEAIDEGAVKNIIDYSKGYLHCRLEYLAVHFIANQLGLSAPAFRKMFKPVGFKDYTEEEELIARDRQLIDFHYLFYNRKELLSCRDADYESVFGHDVTSFEFEQASELVMARGYAATKAEKFLAIPDDVQFELNVLRSSEVRKRCSEYRDRKQKIVSKVSEEQRKSSSRLAESKALAIRSDVLPLLFANGSPSVAVRYKGLMTSTSYDAAEIKKEARRIADSKRWLMNGRVGKMPW